MWRIALAEVLIGHYFWTAIVFVGTILILEITFNVLFGKKSILDLSGFRWYKIPVIFAAMIYVGSLLLPNQTYYNYFTERSAENNENECFYVEATVKGGMYFTSKFNKPDYYAEYVHDELCNVETDWELLK